MNVRKRGLALLMCICMIFTLLPFSALADSIELKKPGGKPVQSSIKIEYWCTNDWVYGSGAQNSKNVTLTNSPQYVNTNTISPEIGTDAPDQSGNTNKQYVYWKTVVLDKDHNQERFKTDRTNDGTEIVAVQMNNNKPAYLKAGDTTKFYYFEKGDQIVSYYKQVVLRSDTYGTITCADWGEKDKNNITTPDAIKVDFKIMLKQGDGSYDEVASDFQWYNKSAGTVSGIGIIPVGDYKISKVTYLDYDGNTVTKENDKVNDEITIYRNRDNTVTYYIEKETDFTLTYYWPFAPATTTDGKAINLPTSSKVTYKYGDKETLDKTYTNKSTGEEDGVTYTFSGWYYDQEYTNPVTTDTVEIKGNTVLYGKWTEVEEPEEYTVTYAYVSDSVNPTTPILPAKQTFEKNALVEIDTTNSGSVEENGYVYSFSGWFTDENLTNKAADFNITQDTTLYGKWTKTPATGTIKINKTVTGLTDEKLPDSFKFEIKHGDTLKDTVIASKNIEGTEITYSGTSKALAYGEYTISEINADVPGYDLNTTGLPDMVTLSAANKNVEVNVTNAYTAPEAATVTLTAKKLLDNDLAKDSFTFVLKDKDNIIIQTKYNNENGIVSFDQLTFAEAGNHIYYISEVAGNNTSIKYDETVYMVTVHVTLNAATGNYDSAVAYSKLLDDGAPAPTTNNEAVFNNTTKPTGSLTISKTVSGNAASTSKYFDFTVTLMQPRPLRAATDGGEAMQSEVKYGDITFNENGIANIKFKLKDGDVKTITGLPDGIRYTVQELDSNGYTVSAKVNGEPKQLENNMLGGTIAAGVETKVAFNNHKNYVYPPNPPIMDEITVEITGNSDSVVYDGTEHSVKGYTVKISDPRYTEADFTFTGKAEASGVNAGTYEMGLKAEQFKNTNARFTNVKFVIKADGVLTITPKDLTITAGSKTEYGPTPVTCGEWTVSGLAAGDKVESVKITGIQSVPGSSPNVPSDAVIKNAKGEDVTKNYAIKYVNGTLTMLEVLNKEDHFNYIIGTPEGLSLPTANVTRAEVATIFFRLMTDDARAKFDSLDNSFSDVAKGKWYNRAISTLAKAGIIKGDPAGTYRPGDPITRAEMAAIIARFGDFKEGGKTFNDISGHWAQKYIELAASNGWINGNPDGTFKPNNNITRAETVAMINRVLDRQTKDVSDLLPVAQMTNWSDNMDTAKWYYRDMQEATNNHKAERVGNSIYEKWTEKLPDIDWASYQI